MPDAPGFPARFPVGKFVWVYPSLDRQMLRRGLQVLAQREDIATDRDQIINDGLDLMLLLAQAQHHAGLGGEALIPGDPQQFQRAAVLRARLA